MNLAGESGDDGRSGTELIASDRRRPLFAAQVEPVKQ